MVIKQSIFYLLFFVLFVSCKNGYINFDEYIKNIMFKNKVILENKIYPIQNLEYTARIIYLEEGTYFNIHDNPSGEQLFSIKYWTKIMPIEIMKTNGSIWVNIETKDHNRGWIESCFIELYRKRKL
jgi:SH3-like domain-containing protein